MTVKDKIINHLLTENEFNFTNKVIDFNCNRLSKELKIDRSNAIDIKKNLIQKGELVELDNKKYKFSNPSKYNYNYSYLVEGIESISKHKLSDNYIRLLGYMHYNYTKFGTEFELGLNKICSESGVSKNKETISKMLERLVELNIIEWIKGNWKEHKVGQFKIKYIEEINIDNNIIPMEQEGKVVISSTEYQQLNDRINKMAIAFKQMMLENSQMKQKIELLEKQLNIPAQPEIKPEQQFEQVQAPEQVQQEIPQPIVEPIETSERDNIYQQYLNNKQKVIEHIKGFKKPNISITVPLNGIVSKVITTNDIQLVYNTCGLDYNKVFYLIPILENFQDNIIYMYLKYKDFQEIITNILFHT